MWRCKFALAFLVGLTMSPCYGFAAPEGSTPEFAPLYNGQSDPTLYYSNIAYITVSDFACSGVLVGSREVLTAGHCVNPSGGAEDFDVYVGGERFGVYYAYYHARYDHNSGPTNDNSRYDIGMLILDREVLWVAPVPIVTELPLWPGLPLRVYGYGSREFPSVSSQTRGQFGDVTIEEVEDGIFLTNKFYFEVSVCSGDSGGPAIFRVGRYKAVVGVTSFTTNKYYDLMCVESSSGLSGFVDVQSTSSKLFLSTFPNLWYASGRLMVLNAVLDDLRGRIASATKKRRLEPAQRIANAVYKELGSLGPLLDSLRAPYIEKARRAVKRASSEKNVKKRNGHFARAQRELDAVGRLGLR